MQLKITAQLGSMRRPASLPAGLSAHC